MLVTLLGYTIQADEFGGYPAGYIKIAEQEKITESLKADLKDFATREDIATMVNAALDVPLMKQTVYGAEPVFERLEEETLFKNYFN